MDQHDDRRVVSIQLGCTGDPSGADRPSAVVARSSDGCGDPSVVVPASSPAAVSEERWYHGDAAPYTHDEERRAGPRYLLWIWFVLLYGAGIGFGWFFGYIIAMGMKGTAMKVLGYALGMCVTLPVVSLLWCPSACDRDG
ncbi:uncharacterized protein [Triticum aestivum]|uniref:uncharacterized protein n=1 Tax=Triticum aestivum TaxID=4565 RepID=UPI001D01C3DD|nr:uncharacterized protein LOC123117611 [Triticum aestivum]